MVNCGTVCFLPLTPRSATYAVLHTLCFLPLNRACLILSRRAVVCPCVGGTVWKGGLPY